MINVIIKTSQDGSTWTDLQTPSAYGLSYEDLDSGSYRSCMTGNLVRKRIKPRWIKLSLTFRRLSDDQLKAIATAINTNAEFYVRCYSPAFGNMSASGGTGDGWVQFKAYCSSYKAELLDAQIGWTCSFNIIQSSGGTFQ